MLIYVKVTEFIKVGVNFWKFFKISFRHVFMFKLDFVFYFVVYVNVEGRGSAKVKFCFSIRVKLQGLDLIIKRVFPLWENSDMSFIRMRSLMKVSASGFDKKLTTFEL